MDDEPELLELTSVYLRTLGYGTFTAPTGSDALALFVQNPAIDLVVTDILMPGEINGIELGRRLAQMRPDLPVLYTSGYAAGSLTWSRDLLHTRAMLQKPYRLHQLAEAIAYALTPNLLSTQPPTLPDTERKLASGIWPTRS